MEGIVKNKYTLPCLTQNPGKGKRVRMVTMTVHYCIIKRWRARSMHDISFEATWFYCMSELRY